MVATLFFIWGFCHAMLDVLNKHFQNLLHVSKTQSGFIQTSVFGAYFLMAFPSALLIRRVGYQKGILMGLVVVAIGAFLFIPAGLVFKAFWAFLFALFVLSTGLAGLETAANPYVTVLGPKDGAAGRLSVAQAFNSVLTSLRQQLVARSSSANSRVSAAKRTSIRCSRPMLCSVAWCWWCLASSRS